MPDLYKDIHEIEAYRKNSEPKDIEKLWNKKKFKFLFPRLRKNKIKKQIDKRYEKFYEELYAYYRQ